MTSNSLTGNKKTKKVAGLIIILLLPSFFYLILSKADHHYRSLPFIGQVIVTEGDSIYHTIPPFELIDQNGDLFSNERQEGKIVVANFFFTHCPTICPKMAAHLLELQNKFENRKDLIIVSHTVDPKNDSVEVLLKYSEKVHAKEGRWYFLTGEKEAIYNLAFDGYFASVQRDEAAPGGFLHSQLIFLVDKKGRLRGTYDDLGNVVPAFDGISTTDMKKMGDAIDNLLLEEFVPRKKH